MGELAQECNLKENRIRKKICQVWLPWLRRLRGGARCPKKIVGGESLWRFGVRAQKRMLGKCDNKDQNNLVITAEDLFQCSEGHRKDTRQKVEGQETQ